MRIGLWPQGMGWLLFSLPFGLLHATTPLAERLEWHGKVYRLMALPLEQRYTAGLARPGFMSAPLDTAGGDGRGYVGSWRLEDDRLYLLEIESWLCKGAAVRKADCRKATLDDVFGNGAKAPVFADWFNGDLVLLDREARAVADSHVANSPTIRITLKAGKVTHIETQYVQPR
jgi:hypothetical protein